MAENDDLRKINAWLGRAAVPAAVVLVFAAFLKVLTYSTGQDPRIYIVLARRLVRSSFDPETLSSISGFIVPGYPLVLAAVMKLFGPLAAYWVNPVFLAGFFVFFTLLVRRCLGGGRSEMVIVLATMCVVLSGYPLNAHYLLYPFRGAPELFFMFLAMHLLERGVRSTAPGAWRWSLAAALALLAGGVLRETVVFVAAGMLAWMVARPAWGRPRTRRSDLLAFLLPLAAAAVAVLAVGLWRGELLNMQWRVWFNSLLGRFPSKPVGRSLREMLVLLRSEFGWFLLPLAVGLVRAVRRPAALFLFALHALLFLVFYACFKPHPRYLLTVVVFLGPLAGWGIAAILDGLERIPRVPRALPYAAAVVLLAALNVHAVARLGLWGPRVTRCDVVALTRSVDALVPPGSPLLVDKSCRYLVDVLTVFTDVEPVDPLTLGTNLVAQPPLVFAEPLDEACFYPDKHGVRAALWIRRHADLRTPEGAGPDVCEFSLGDGGYRCGAVVPWTCTQAVERVEFEPGRAALLWLDFGNAGAGTRRDVELGSAAGATLGRWRTDRSRGLQAFYVPASAVTSEEAEVRVASRTPFPSRVVAAVDAADDLSRFDLADGRRPSVDDWLEPPFEGVGRPSSKYAALFVRGGTLRLPVPHGMRKQPLVVRVEAAPRNRQDIKVPVRYRARGRVVAEEVVDLRDPGFRHVIELRPPRNAPAIELRMEADVPDGFDNHFRMISVGFAVLPPGGKEM